MKDWTKELNEINKNEAKNVLSVKLEALSNDKLKNDLIQLSKNYNLELARKLYMLLKPYDSTLYVKNNTNKMMVRTETLKSAEPGITILLSPEKDFFIEILPVLPNLKDIKTDITHYKKLNNEEVVKELENYLTSKMDHHELNFAQFTRPEYFEKAQASTDKNEVKDKDEARGRLY